ncbi:MAG: FkbM family methyltransferase [Acidobacteria bacterium]|nr:FkbM family methyltransferase [Acidobacteriota bacterium]
MLAGNDLLRSLAGRLTSPLTVVDVGARWGAGERWRSLGPAVRVIGFEPDVVECERLSATETDVRYVPVALGAQDGAVVLHRTADPACASVYPPRADLPEARPELHVVAEVGTVSVAMNRLDTWLDAEGIPEVHVLKLDTQGSELDVLRGAERALRQVRLLEVEVEFNPIYEGQPLFGDVDEFLRRCGFVLWRLSDLAHYGLADVPSSDAQVSERHFYDSRVVLSTGEGGQLFWAHAYYVASDIAYPRGGRDEQQLLRDAVAVAAFGFTDLATSLLSRAGLAAAAG